MTIEIYIYHKDSTIWKSQNQFLSAMSLRSKDLNSSFFCIETKSWQKHQSLSDSNNLANLNNVNKEFLPKKSSQKNPPQKKLPKNSTKKIPTKKSS